MRKEQEVALQTNDPHWFRTFLRGTLPVLGSHSIKDTKSTAIWKTIG